MLRKPFARLASRLLLAAGAMIVLPAPAAVVEKAVDYEIDGVTHRGYFYFDDTVKTARALVLLVPNWLGTNATNRRQAAEIAGQRYVVFVADMYGAERQPADPQAAGKAVQALYGNRALLRARATAAHAAAVQAAPALGVPADVSKVAAIGFCFGGATVLELARTGIDIAAAVSLHGNLSLPGTIENAPIRARILALHGDADPYVPAEQVEAFVKEMRAADVDWQLVSYGGAVHSFTDPDANMPGQAMYDAKIARRAFATMHDFLAEAFASVD
ncbi:dienelactone hydrolase family protein [Sinimarinibacterium thermocellulolyticum]|uniref:Dienelactone hydrolase family protein n=1 Tax=Sinimarinibacterium thermocellulolyticum TaxID=3170016 RepID=A0ABV2AAL1_9GAMM